MNTFKIIAIVTLAIVAAAVLTVTVYGYTSGYQYWGGGCGSFGGYSTVPPTYANGTYATQLNITTAETIATSYLSRLNNPDLAVKEIEEYSLNFYVQYYEKSSGIGAFEMLINPYTGAITPEPGPNMMWNTKYGMMSGMMGFYAGTPTATMPASADQANADAQQWLNINIPGATVGEVFPFYGYYHVMAMVNGTNYGMMSVNGYTGEVWYHTWHGTFIQEVDLS